MMHKQFWRERRERGSRYEIGEQLLVFCDTRDFDFPNGDFIPAGDIVKVANAIFEYRRGSYLYNIHNLTGTQNNVRWVTASSLRRLPIRKPKRLHAVGISRVLLR